MDGDENAQDEDEVYEPQVTSEDPNERKLARRLRIQKRLQVVRKQHHQEGEAEPEEIQKTLLEQQVQDSKAQIEKLLLEGRELVTNVRVANDAREVRRREDQVVARENRLKHLEEEAADSMQKFEAINEKWEEISKSNDPLDIFHDMALQKDKCLELIEEKNKLISELRNELKKADDRFNRDQRKQKEDLALLVERINNQVNVMRRAYRQELNLIEQAIAIEHKQLLEGNNKRWDVLYKEREKEEVINMDKKFEQVSKYEDEIQRINIEHQEKFRESKIQLETDIQILQQELEQVKALCLLNSEKLDYNYQVLKKRDDENLIMKAQQKRRINKLQDVVNGLKKKITETENMTMAETRHLTDEVMRLHRNIIDIEKKADHFSEINDKKYQQVWEMNKDAAKNLLDKILTTDRIIHEQQLGLEWKPPDISLLTKNDLASYQSAMKVVTDLFQNKDVSPADSRTNSSTTLDKVEKMELKTFQEHDRLMRHILQRIADNSGFLIEDRLKSLLHPYKCSEKTLIKIDNVFSALGITTEADMLMLKEFFMPYLKCDICTSDNLEELQESEIAASNMVQESEIATSNLVQESEIAVSNLVQESEIAASNVVQESEISASNLVQASEIAVSNLVQESEIAASNLVQESEIAVSNLVQESDISISNLVQESEISISNLVQESEISISNLVQELEKAVSNKVQESEIAASDMVQESEIAASDMAQESEITVSNMAQESEIAVSNLAKTRSSVSYDGSSELLTSTSLTEVLEYMHSTAVETQYKDKELIQPYTKDIVVVKQHCTLDHPQTIDPIYVLKALREFMAKFSKRKEKIVVNMSSRLSHKRSTVSRLMCMEDVTTYWTRFRQIFSPEREKLWDGLLMGLHKYHGILDERHKLNVQTEHLRQQNAELRRLLQRYMLATGSDSNFPSRDVLPPLKQVDSTYKNQSYKSSSLKFKSSTKKCLKMNHSKE